MAIYVWTFKDFDIVSSVLATYVWIKEDGGGETCPQMKLRLGMFWIVLWNESKIERGRKHIWCTSEACELICMRTATLLHIGFGTWCRPTSGAHPWNLNRWDLMSLYALASEERSSRNWDPLSDWSGVNKKWVLLMHLLGFSWWIYWCMCTYSFHWSPLCCHLKWGI